MDFIVSKYGIKISSKENHHRDPKWQKGSPTLPKNICPQAFGIHFTGTPRFLILRWCLFFYLIQNKTLMLNSIKY